MSDLIKSIGAERRAYERAHGRDMLTSAEIVLSVEDWRELYGEFRDQQNAAAASGLKVAVLARAAPADANGWRLFGMPLRVDSTHEGRPRLQQPLS